MVFWRLDPSPHPRLTLDVGFCLGKGSVGTYVTRWVLVARQAAVISSMRESVCESVRPCARTVRLSESVGLSVPASARLCVRVSVRRSVCLCVRPPVCVCARVCVPVHVCGCTPQSLCGRDEEPDLLLCQKFKDHLAPDNPKGAP